MKAAVYDRYGPPGVVRLAEVERPAPGRDEVRVRVHATSVTAGDARLRAFRVPPLFWLPARASIGLTRPKNRILGSEFAGTVESVGPDVTRWSPGDEVFGFRLFGCHAEYLCIAERGVIAAKPAGLTFAEAAAVPFGGLTALFFLRKAGIARGQKVLVNGASGGVGTAAVQLARHFGAEVTGVCSTANVELVRSLGAERVVDYTREDFTQGGQTYDVILDTIGNTSFSRCKPVLSSKGVHVFLVIGAAQMIQSLWTARTGGRKVLAGTTEERPEDLAFLRDLVEAGDLRPVIDRNYPLERIVEAHAHVDTAHKKGSVVIVLDRPEVG